MTYNLEAGQYWFGYWIMNKKKKREPMKNHFIIYRIDRLTRRKVFYFWGDDNGSHNSYSSYQEEFIKDLEIGERRLISQAQAQCLWTLWEIRR